jgi:hypothetical protein
MGQLANLREEDLRRMQEADVFIDACGEQFFANASIRLDVPILTMLADRPDLIVPDRVQREAACWCAAHAGRGDSRFVAMNLDKHDGETLHRHAPLIRRILDAALDDPRVVVLNLFTSVYDFAHWPEADRARRCRASIEAAAFLQDLGTFSDRIIACVDLPLTLVAGLLARSRYFIGVDNGIKHLAWALDVPRTFLHPTKPDILRVIRWMPDLHRLLRFDCHEAALDRHLAAMRAAITR